MARTGGRPILRSLLTSGERCTHFYDVSVSLPVGIQEPSRSHLSPDGALVRGHTADLVQRVARFIPAAFFER